MVRCVYFIVGQFNGLGPLNYYNDQFYWTYWSLSKRVLLLLIYWTYLKKSSIEN